MNSKKIYDFLPEDGSTVSGGDIRTKFSLSKAEWTAVKEELKASGRIILGRGRGGTVKRNLDESQHIKKPKKLSKAEIAEHAREVKQAKANYVRLREKIESLAQKEIEGMFEDAQKVEIHVANYNGLCYVYPFYDGKAQAHRLWVEV